MNGHQFFSEFAPVGTLDENVSLSPTLTHRLQIEIGRRPTIVVGQDGTLQFKEKEDTPTPEPTVIEPILMNCQDIREKYTSISESIVRIDSEIKAIQLTEQDLTEKEAKCMDAIHAFTVSLDIHMDTHKTVAGLLEFQRQFKEVYSEEFANLLQNQAARLQKLLNEKDILIKNRQTILSFFRDVNDTLTEDDKSKIHPNICGVCYENHINRVCVPCGHVFCDGCVPKLRGKCATCNINYQTVIKLFMNTAGEVGGS